MPFEIRYDILNLKYTSIYKDKPEEGVENWLPTYDGVYRLELRVYKPSEDVVSAPAIINK